MEKHILLIGIGNTGCRVADTVSGKMQKTDIDTTSICVTAEKDFSSSFGRSSVISVASEDDFTKIVERLGAECISHWLPKDVMNEDFTRNFSAKMDDGAASWRAKAMLLFVNYLSQPEKRQKLDGIISDLCASCADDDEIEIYTVADIGDGAGSGLLVPLALYVNRAIRATVTNKVRATAMVVGAGAYSENQMCEELYIKAYANMYACMRELHAINLAAHSSEGEADFAPVSIQLGAKDDPAGVLFDSEDPAFCTPAAKPFSKVCLFDRVPNVQEGTPYEIMLSDILYTVCSDSFRLDYTDEISSNTVDAIYSGISMRSISYPEDGIMSYMSRKNVLDELCGWHAVHSRIKDISRKNIIAKQKRVIREEELFLGYCDSFISELDATYVDAERDDLIIKAEDIAGAYAAEMEAYGEKQKQEKAEAERADAKKHSDEPTEVTQEVAEVETAEENAEEIPDEPAEETQEVAEAETAEENAEEISDEPAEETQEVAEVETAEENAEEISDEPAESERAAEETEDVEKSKRQKKNNIFHENCIGRYLAKLDIEIDKKLIPTESPVVDFLFEKIPEKGTPEYKKYKRLGFFAQKRRLSEIIGQINPFFESWYAACVNAYVDGKESFVDNILGGELSLTQSVAEGGEISPIRTMYILCGLHRALKERVEREIRLTSLKLKKKTEKGDYNCPEVFFIRADDRGLDRTHGKYSLQGKGRLLRAFDCEKMKVGGMQSDETVLREDLKFAYDNFVGAFRAEWLSLVLDEVRREISRYYATFNYMRHYVVGWSDEVQSVSEHISSVSFPAAKIRISSDDIVNAYELFKKNEQECDDRDVLEEHLGRTFFEITREVSFDEEGSARISGEQFAHLWERGCERSVEILSEHPFVKEHLRRNILEAMISPDRDCFPSQNMADQLIILFAPLYSPFRVDAAVFRKTDGAVRSHTDFIFPTGSKESAQILIDRGECNAASPEELIRGIVIKGGAYEGNVVFSDNVDSKSILVCCETFGLQLNCIEQFNEMSNESKGYSLYKEALSRQRKFESIVWGPHIRYAFDVCGSLPYINAAKQRAYESEICKALAYVKIFNVLQLVPDEDGEPAYSYISSDGPRYITLDGQLIRETEYDKLILWLMQNPERQRAWYNAYRRELSGEIAALPGGGGMGGISLVPLYDAICRSDLITGLSKLMMPVVNSIRLANAPVCGHIFAERFARVAYTALTDVCDSRFARDDEIYTDLYMYVLRKFGAAAYVQSAQDSAELFAWLNEKELFRACAENNEMCDYTPDAPASTT